MSSGVPSDNKTQEYSRKTRAPKSVKMFPYDYIYLPKNGQICSDFVNSTMKNFTST